MRDGQVVRTLAVADTDEHELSEMMVGRQVHLSRNIQFQPRGDVMLEAKHLFVRHDKGYMAANDINFQVAGGEIVGITGVDGNGQLELGEAIAGLRRMAGGEIRVEREAVKRPTPAEMMKRGLGHIPDDRHKKGLVLDFSVQDNVLLGCQRQHRFRKGLFCDYQRLRDKTLALQTEYDIRFWSLKQSARGLSGGNQQKVILARVLDCGPKVILAIQPTRGLDIGAVEFVREKLVEERGKGRAVLLISTDLDEVRSLCDRIYVICNGELSESLPFDTPVQELGLMMSRNSAAAAAPPPVRWFEQDIPVPPAAVHEADKEMRTVG
jgi:simple sugar transport system ATP-binding protein